MKTMIVRAEMSADGVLKVEVPCDEPPGHVEVVLTIQARRPLSLSNDIDWGHLSGLGREVWKGVDAASYLRELRADREPPK